MGFTRKDKQFSIGLIFMLTFSTKSDGFIFFKFGIMIKLNDKILIGEIKNA
jgi:hypothetical protein